MRIWLKSMRNEKGFTHQYVADKAGIERAYYTMIESGDRNPSVPVAKSIANVIGFEWTIFFENVCNEMKHKSKEVS
ncbi:helix-turn-helix transcriptional regulator [Siminovitchia terrae]|uniref:helix-turn-helix transcriptional regulator n=1 Tax=Siminovitchia terrae TaxID=1914933 RepID=UPI0028AC1725|nr:helix-turn-helix transcriptional regulator [Siminovitchia terrae]